MELHRRVAPPPAAVPTPHSLDVALSTKRRISGPQARDAGALRLQGGELDLRRGRRAGGAERGAPGLNGTPSACRQGEAW